MGNEADGGGEFFEVPTVPCGKYYPVLQAGDAVLNSCSDAGDYFVELFLPFDAWLVRCFPDRCDGGGCDVGAVGHPCGIRFSKEVTPATLLDHPGVMAGSGERVGDRHEVSPVGGCDLDAEALELPFPGVVRCASTACWAVPCREVWVPSTSRM